MQPQQKNTGFKVFGIVLLAMLLTPLIYFIGSVLGSMVAVLIFDNGKAIAKTGGAFGLLGLIALWRYALKHCGYSWRKGKGFTPD